VTSSGSSGTGNRRFTYVYESKQGKAVCTFGGIEFSLVDNRALFGYKAVSFEKPTTVFFSLEGNIEKQIIPFSVDDGDRSSSGAWKD